MPQNLASPGGHTRTVPFRLHRRQLAGRAITLRAMAPDQFGCPHRRSRVGSGVLLDRRGSSSLRLLFVLALVVWGSCRRPAARCTSWRTVRTLGSAARPSPLSLGSPANLGADGSGCYRMCRSDGSDPDAGGRTRTEYGAGCGGVGLFHSSALDGRVEAWRGSAPGPVRIPIPAQRVGGGVAVRGRVCAAGVEQGWQRCLEGGPAGLVFCRIGLPELPRDRVLGR